MGALRCGHPLSVANLEPAGRYLRCKTCRRSAQNAWHRARRGASVLLAERLQG